MLFYQFQKELIGGQIAFLRYFAHDAAFGVVVPVVVVVANIKEAIVFDAVGLMHLKVKANCAHIVLN